MTPILILVAFLALAAGYFAGRFTARAATDARSAELQRALQDMQTQKAVAEARLQAERVQAAEAARRQAEELKKEFHAIASDLARTESESLQHRHTEALRASYIPLMPTSSAFMIALLRATWRCAPILSNSFAKRRP